MPWALRVAVASVAAVGPRAVRRAFGHRAIEPFLRSASLADLTPDGPPSPTVKELGMKKLAKIAGGEPVTWEERSIARILESTGQDDYGEITQLLLDLGDGQGSKSYIAKRVRPRKDSSVSRDPIKQAEHYRFLKSFAVEAAAYRELAEPLAEKGIVIPKAVHLPKTRPGQPYTLLMEDLSDRFPRGAGGQMRTMSRKEVQAALRWLAAFHAAFWEDAQAKERGLHERGSYWILDGLGTLELESVKDKYKNKLITNAEFQRIRAAAEAVDARLAGRRATDPYDLIVPTHRTLVHGDAKFANMLCSAHGGELECAAIDFAWTGEGYGMYDVVYLLWGIMNGNEVKDHLAYYHKELVQRLPSAARKAYTFTEMLKHFELCVLDFMRWWIGFYGGIHFWAMPWALELMRVALNRLDGGQLKTPEEYAIAVDEIYGFDS